MDKGKEAYKAAAAGDLETLSRLVREDAGVANWVNKSVRTRLCAPPDLTAAPLPRLAHPLPPAPLPALSVCAAAAERRRVAAPHAAPPRARGRSVTTTRRSSGPP